MLGEISSAYTSIPLSKSTNPTDSLGKDAFMKLLVSQLRYQNPLEPMDNRDFIAQLSQFSSLEQLTDLRETFDASLQQQKTMNQTLAVGLLGQTVNVPTNLAVLHGDGEETSIHYYLESDAKSVEIQIKDVNGAVVRTLTPGAQPMGDQEVVWNGTDDLGNALPEGNYTYHVLAVGGGDLPVPVLPFFQGRVDGLRLTEEGIMLKIEGREIPLSQVEIVHKAGKTGDK
ncbi:MAG: hypothetical protein O3A46_05360 [Candidatus Poribacteria bacterium]|nr:hypothetical protein [Candidatus Poribacteria bacterium]